MNEECVILLSCCRGGLNQVAYTLFLSCDNVSYVIGPRQSLAPAEMLISYNILLFNMEFRRMDAVVACKKIESATDMRFVCFDRLEVETEPTFIAQQEQRMKEIEESMKLYFENNPL
jgi:protein-disulfide isomerase-like protein with CxxC motif